MHPICRGHLKVYSVNEKQNIEKVPISCPEGELLIYDSLQTDMRFD